jgi:hypothetical protein
MTTITYTATDGNNNSTSATQVVTVIDNTVPTIALTGTSITLWPPNHSYHTINASELVAGASDNCDPNVNASAVVIARVTSDEVENGNGDGNTSNDIIIGANCKSVQLRAERGTSGNGRVYTITLRVTDASGNSATANVKINVPKNQSDAAAVDDGPHYTVNGNCP